MSELSLQPDLGIEQVVDLHQALLPHLENEAPISIAADRVQRVHGAGLQLLHAFMRDRGAAGRSTTLSHPSPVLVTAAHQLALAASLGVDTPPR